MNASVSLRSLIEPRSNNEDARRREYILNIILAGSGITCFLLDGLVLYYALILGNHASGVSVALFSILPAFLILLYALSRRGFFALASYLLIAAYFLGTSYAAYRWGVNVPTELVGYALLIVIASILISPRFAFFVAGATGLVVLPLWYAQLHGLMFTDAENFTDGDGIAIVVLYGLITLVAWLSNREIEKSLTRARRSEHELKEERDSLEVKVVERTRELHVIELEKIDHLYRFAEFGQLASGLFHDLLNLVQTVSLRAERSGGMDGVDGANGGSGSAAMAASDANKKMLANAFSVQGEIDRFRDAFRKQLSRDDVKESFSLATGIENVCQFLSYQAKNAGVRLEFEDTRNGGSGEGRDDDHDSFAYFGSPLKFHQVVMNLVLNAIEAGGKHVVVRLVRENHFFVLTIADDGSGIAANVQAKIFDPFFTTKQGGDKQGTGIGLAITKRIVENDLHGSISVSNKEGTTFTVRFPLINETIPNNRIGTQDMSRGDQG